MKKLLEWNLVDNNDVLIIKNFKEYIDVLNGIFDKNDILNNGSLLISNEYLIGWKLFLDE